MAQSADLRFERYRRERDPDDLAAVFDECAYDLLKVAMHLCPDDADAEDLVQQTFLEAIQHANRYRPGHPVRAWLLGILQNLARSARRKARSRARLPQARDASAPCPSDLLSRAEFRTAFQTALAGIPMPYRQVVELRLVHGLPAQEIALRLERSPGTVRTQVYRALEMLRRALPGALAGMLGVHLSTTRGMAAVRAAVVERARTTTLATTAVGALIAMKTALLAIGGAAAALAVWLAWPDPTTDPIEGAATPVTAAIPSAAGDDAEPAAPVAEERQAVAPRVPPAAASEDGVVRVDPYAVRVLAVDADGSPVPGAAVEVWTAGRIRLGDAGALPSTGVGTPPEASSWAYRGRAQGAPPILTSFTDATGRASFEVDHELCRLSIHKDGVGRSGDCTVTARRSGAEWRVVLRPVTTIVGVVVGSDGTGHPGASVRAIPIGGEADLPPPSPSRTDSDRDGTFRLDLCAGSTYRLLAEAGGIRSDPLQVVAPRGGARREVTLQLPGAFVARGTVLTPSGDPVGEGHVELWMEGRRQSSHRGAPVRGGRFEIPLSEPGRYVVRASASDHAYSPALRIDLTDVARTADVVLRLESLQTISGRVLGPDGAAVGGAVLKAWRQSPDGGHTETREPLLAESARDGSFRFERSHPSAEYTIVCVPDPERPHVEARRPGVRGDTSDLEIRVDRDLLEGARVVGHLLDGSTGAAIRRFEVHAVQHAGGGLRTFPAKPVVADDGAFEVDGLVVGERYSLVFAAPDALDTLSEPFVATLQTTPLELHTPVAGTVSCRVLQADGSPAPGVLVSAVPEDGIRSLAIGATRTRTDASGRATLRVVPGDHVLHFKDAGSATVPSRRIAVSARRTLPVEITIERAPR